jgi:hypothetical protein
MSNDLNKQFEEIEKRIEAGETVQINLNSDGQTLKLAVDENNVTDVSDLESLEPEEGAGETFNLDASPTAASDDEVVKAIDSIEPLEALSDLPTVVLTKNEKGWVLHEDCTYKTKNGDEITALKGFETDLASIPRVFWTLLSADELSLAAPVFHDLLYRSGGVLSDNQIKPTGKKFVRKDVDNLFLEIMEIAEIPKWKRLVAYRAVRTFASFAWKGE